HVFRFATDFVNNVVKVPGVGSITTRRFSARQIRHLGDKLMRHRLLSAIAGLAVGISMLMSAAPAQAQQSAPANNLCYGQHKTTPLMLDGVQTYFDLDVIATGYIGGCSYTYEEDFYRADGGRVAGVWALRIWHCGT